MREKQLVVSEMLATRPPFACDAMCRWRPLSMLAPNSAEGRKSLGGHYASNDLESDLDEEMMKKRRAGGVEKRWSEEWTIVVTNGTN